VFFSQLNNNVNDVFVFQSNLKNFK